MLLQVFTGRRSVLASIGMGTMTVVAGCSGLFSNAGPPQLRLNNYDSEAHSLGVSIQKQVDGTAILDENYSLGPKSERLEENVFESAGTYQVDVVLDRATERSFTWDIETVPMGGGFRLVIEESEALHDDVVGSP